MNRQYTSSHNIVENFSPCFNFGMAKSLSAEAVAHEVLDAIRQGKIPNKQKIQIKHGYSPASARAMKATRTESYQAILCPFVEQLARHREKRCRFF
jgi:hypothetical protein